VDIARLAVESPDAHKLRIYNYMAGGLAVTGVVAYGSAASGFYQSIAGTPLIWVVMLAPLAFVFALSFGIERMSAATAAILFVVYAAVMGCRSAASSSSSPGRRSPASSSSLPRPTGR
jgi:FtsH-binding integral membrane protein